MPSTPDRPPSPVQNDPEKPAVRSHWLSSLRLDIWRTPFAGVLLAMLGLHLTQYLAIPLFPLFSVNVLHLTDQSIGIGTALYYLTSMLGSTQLNRIVRRLGHRKVTGLGFMIMSLYPGLMAFAHSAYWYYFVSIIGGFSWALMGSAYMNYILETIPENDRPAHLAWYNIVLNASILIGSLARSIYCRLHRSGGGAPGCGHITPGSRVCHLQRCVWPGENPGNLTQTSESVRRQLGSGTCKRAGAEYSSPQSGLRIQDR